MPELPEVETVRRLLEPQLAGRVITAVTLNRPEIILHPLPAVFADAARGQTVSALGRRGKFLSIVLANRSTIVLHLRMTGCLLAVPADFPLAGHTHVIFQLDNGSQLRFIDPRRFGRLWLFGAGETDTVSGINRLGLEPFAPALTAAFLRSRWGGRRKPVKNCLLDQHDIAGIGNIYADEILFTAAIRPDRQAASLSLPEWQALTAAIPAVLQKALEDNRVSAAEYLADGGRVYRNSPLLRVYGRDGEPCCRCGTRLQKIVLAGRASCYCPDCQK